MSINGDSKPQGSGSTVTQKRINLGIVELFGLHLLGSHFMLQPNSDTSAKPSLFEHKHTYIVECATKACSADLYQLCIYCAAWYTSPMREPGHDACSACYELYSCHINKAPGSALLSKSIVGPYLCAYQ